MEVIAVAATVAVLGAFLALPFVVLAHATRQSWPRHLRLLHSIHAAQLGCMAYPVTWFVEATILAIGERAGQPVISIAASANGREELGAGGTWTPDDLRRLRHWHAERIPVLVLQREAATVEVHGPSGVVLARVTAD